MESANSHHCHGVENFFLLYRSQLSQALVSTSRKWASHIAAEESERLTPIVEALSARQGGINMSC